MRKAIILGSLLALAVTGSFLLTDRTHPTAHAGSPAFQSLLSDAISRLEGVTQEIVATSVSEAQAAGKQATVYGEITCDRDNTECWDLTYDAGSPTCEASIATCDATETCSRFYTCDSQYTCHGEVTCDGKDTCWNSTCDQEYMTCDGSETCDAACVQYTYQGNYTCDGTITCHETCSGWPNCGVETMFPSETCDRNDPNCWDLTYNQGEATCDPAMPTCGTVATCSRFYTCDSQYTCHGEETCNGQFTCWSSTCIDHETCDGAPQCCQDPYTFQGNFTCDGSETCHNTCDAWPTCDGLVTCDGTVTCHETCDGWLGCYNGGPTGSDRTTWGGLKREFGE